MDKVESGEADPTAWSGGVANVYANIFNLDWTLYDLTIRFGHLRYGDPSSRKLTIQEQASVTMAWAEAKYLRNSLGELIAKYETLNGEIQHPKLAPAE